MTQSYSRVAKIVLLCICSSIATLSYSQEESANIEGDLNTNNQNSNNNNVTNSTTNVGPGSGQPTPVNTSVAPSLMSNGSDTCLLSRSSGLQVLQLGLSGGYYKQDDECNRRRDSRVLADLGLTIAAVSRMCQNVENWKAMFNSGTPCPLLVNGEMIYGKNAILVMRTNPEVYIPDYNKNSKYYNQILGIGSKGDLNVQENVDSNSASVSERFRSSSGAND